LVAQTRRLAWLEEFGEEGLRELHVEIDPGGKECSYALALSLSENGNRCRQMALVDAPLIFNVSHTSKYRELQIGTLHQ